MRWWSLIIAVTLLILSLAGCWEGENNQEIYDKYNEQVESVGPLTADTVERYVNAYRDLRSSGVSYLKFMEDNQSSLDSGKAVLRQIEDTLKQNGFKNYAEFVKVNAKIAWAWTVSQGQIGLRRFQNLQKQSQEMIQEMGIDVINESLADPEIPESTKTDLRKQLAELKAQAKELTVDYEKSRKWADVVIDYVSPLTSKHDMEVIMLHEGQLLEVFSGLSAAMLDQVQQQSLRQLDHVR